MRHFERAQIAVIWYSKDGENLNAEYCHDIADGIEMAKRVLYMDFDKCVARFPDDVMKHTTHYADVHDSLNRSCYFHRIRIDENREITITRLKENMS